MVQIRYVLLTIIGVVFYGKNKYFFLIEYCFNKKTA